MNKPPSLTDDTVVTLGLLKNLNEPTREYCYGKIHRCVVTQAELDYVGSITIDPALLRAAKIFPYSKVEVVNISRKDAARIMTYVIEGEEDSGTICLNGAAAHHFQRGDLAIIMAYEQVPVSLIPHREHITVQVNGEEGITKGKTNIIRSVHIYNSPTLDDLGDPENNRLGERYQDNVVSVRSRVK
jgi:aspartate 1-decarboxylase